MIFVSQIDSIVDFGIHPGLREFIGDWQAEYYYFPSSKYPNGARMYGNYTFGVVMDSFVERNFKATLEVFY